MDPSKSSIDIALLARQTLQQARAPAEPIPSEDATYANDGDPEGAPTSTLDLIDAYFACEDPSERDLVFEALCERPLVETQSFFAAMSQHDQDPILRVQAAAYLAKGQVESAWAQLQEVLEVTKDATLVEEILSAAVEADPARGFDWAETTFDDLGRASRIRCAAMRVMSATDPSRASLVFLSHLPKWIECPKPPQDLIERALSALAFEKPPGAAARVQSLLDALVMRPNVGLSDAIREDLCCMLDECRLLLEA